MTKPKFASPSDCEGLGVKQLRSILSTFAHNDRFFSVHETVDIIGAGGDYDAVRRSLEKDSRFILVDGQRTEDTYFIFDASLFGWLAKLNLRLAQDSVAILSMQEFVNELNDLSDQTRWASPPQEILNFGSHYGLVSTATNGDQYTFPLAWVLSRVGSTVLSEVAEALQAFEDLDTRSWWLNRSIADTVEEGLINFPEKEAMIVRGRESLTEGGRLILQVLGCRLNLTRERVRQLEAQFWSRLLWPSSKESKTSHRRWKIGSVELRRAFVNAFLANFMRGHGSLVVPNTSIESKLILFCAKCIGLPISDVPQTEDQVIGAFPSDLTALEDISWNPDYQFGENPALCSALAQSLPLVMADLHLISADARRAWMSHTTKTLKVSLVLRAIGRPAHYSEVTATYQSMFPEEQTKERNIHVILTRRRYGVIWTGVRGIYALEEW